MKTPAENKTIVLDGIRRFIQTAADQQVEHSHSQSRGALAVTAQVTLEALMATRSSNLTAPTQFTARLASNAYCLSSLWRRHRTPCCCSFSTSQEHSDNWDWAVTDPLAKDREVILFDNAGIGRSSESVPTTVAEMTTHVLGFPRWHGPGSLRCPGIIRSGA